MLPCVHQDCQVDEQEQYLRCYALLPLEPTHLACLTGTSSARHPASKRFALNCVKQCLCQHSWSCPHRPNGWSLHILLPWPLQPLPPAPLQATFADVLPWLLKLAVAEKAMWWRIVLAFGCLVISKGAGWYLCAAAGQDDAHATTYGLPATLPNLKEHCTYTLHVVMPQQMETLSSASCRSHVPCGIQGSN
jgi:hypothetical protein